ncbi:hypothetical protein SLVCU150_2190 [Staphylococcus lugdunensis VCU150]|nr:hypothetical protein SLVCU150_2190 [Staphylococcus lugdunensis VCU150]
MNVQKTHAYTRNELTDYGSRQIMKMIHKLTFKNKTCYS